MDTNVKQNAEMEAFDELLNTKAEKAKKPITVKSIFKRYFIDAFTGMAQGLFVTLIAGLIIQQIGKLFGDSEFARLLIAIGNVAKALTGAGIGAGIAKSLKASNLTIFATIIAGFIGAYSEAILAGTFALSYNPGNPISAYVCSVFACEMGNLISGKTKLDILLVPLVVMLAALLGCYIAKPAIILIDWLSTGIEKATGETPFVMGILISVIMGILLTMPTSSAAIWIAIAAQNTSDAMLLAGGAAVVGCAAQMVGFAVSSFRENGFSGIISQGLGTSMLQIPNIMKKPRIFLPPIIASAIVGPLSTVVFKLKCTAAGGGMGTSGFVGVIGVIDASKGVLPDWQIALGIILLMFVLPASISLLCSELMRKKGFIKYGDMQL